MLTRTEIFWAIQNLIFVGIQLCVTLLLFLPRLITPGLVDSLFQCIASAAFRFRPGPWVQSPEKLGVMLATLFSFVAARDHLAQIFVVLGQQQASLGLEAPDAPLYVVPTSGEEVEEEKIEAIMDSLTSVSLLDLEKKERGGGKPLVLNFGSCT
uniref:Uncharacterized protein n=1 Tax=Paramoeba aestuarina TaxID=180227 RepID=A0A7S4NP31_9EUKA|mmetsp:Transcript_22535/g.35024  ORF Transcript_22535/g.35024 Transcript_22535/m.35024 type:complete len:154 (+) Transcript_22535:121-582(+)